MMYLRWMIFLAFVVAGGGVAWGDSPIYFVATNGNDAWSGTRPDPSADGRDGPFATLHRAQEALRAGASENTGLPDGGMVYVREGTYFLDRPLEFGAMDSGTRENAVVWQAYWGERVRLVAGRRVDGFVAHEDGIYRREFAPEERPVAPFAQLFFNGERQTPARWPNKSDAGMPGGAWTFTAASVEEDRNRSFHYLGDRPSQWAGQAGVQVSIWPNYNWWQTIAEVAEIDVEKRIVRLKEELPYTIEPGRRLFFQSILAELDVPGEWHYDAAGGVLHFRPPGPLDGAEVIIPALDHAVVFDNAHHIAFIGFTIEAAHDDAVMVRDSQECIIARCTIRNVGGFGVTVRGGMAVRVAGNDIHNTGRGGIVINGGDRKTLAYARHEAINNHIHHFAEIYQTYQTGVHVQGVGNYVGHNLVHDAPHIAILLNGNDHLIEYNRIHHVCLAGSDNGAFYMGRDWTERGNVIRYNIFHDIYGFGMSSAENGVFRYESPYQAWGVYLDDCSSGTTVFGNLFYRVPLCGVMVGGGRDIVVKNNIFVESVPAFHIDARWDAYCWDLMQERLEAMNYREPPYSERYPELLEIEKDPRRPMNNVFVRNLIFYARDDFRGLSSAAVGSAEAVIYDLDRFDPATTKIENNFVCHYGLPVRVRWRAFDESDAETLSWEDWRARGFDQNSIVDNPVFFDIASDDYQIPPDSAVFRTGFKPIPLWKIGLYEDEFRASWPPPQARRSSADKHYAWTVILAELEGADGAYDAPPAVTEAPPPPPLPLPRDKMQEGVVPPMGPAPGVGVPGMPPGMPMPGIGMPPGMPMPGIGMPEAGAPLTVMPPTPPPELMREFLGEGQSEGGILELPEELLSMPGVTVSVAPLAPDAEQAPEPELTPDPEEQGEGDQESEP